MTEENILALFPSFGEITGDKEYEIVCNHHNFKVGTYIILYEVYSPRLFFRLHDKTKDFCEAIGMDEINTLLWVIQFVENLPRELEVHHGGFLSLRQ